MGPLAVFLGTLGISALALLALVFLVPERFGLSPRGPWTLGTGPVGAGGQPAFAPRPEDSGGIPEMEARRAVVPRRDSPPTLAQRIFEDAQSSVVHVTTLSSDRRTFVHTAPVAGWGSGLIWDRHGHIITSLHVLESVDGATVTLSNGQQFPSRLVGVDEASDLAVIRIDAPPELLTPIRIGTSSDLRVGMAVFSLACPYGIAQSLATGHVSGLNREIRSTTGRRLSGTIQADVALHPGSSGGALIDDQGRVIGLNAAIHQDSGQFAGVGFAVPIDQLQESVPQIIETGFRWYHRLGIATFSESRSAELLQRAVMPGIDPDGDTPDTGPEASVTIPDAGLVIAEIVPGSPAQAAGLRGMQSVRHPDRPEELRVRDIVISAGGQPVTRPLDLEKALRKTPSGDSLELEIARATGMVRVTVTPRR